MNGTRETLLIISIEIKRKPINVEYMKWWTDERESEEVIVPVMITTTKRSLGKDLCFVCMSKGGKSQ